MLETLRQFGLGGLGIRLEDVDSPGKAVQLGIPPNGIDLMTAVSGLSFEEAWESRDEVELEEVPADFIGREALIGTSSAGRRGC